MTTAVLLMELCVVTLLLGWLWVLLPASSWPPPWVILLAAPLGLVSGRLIPWPWRRLSWFDATWWGAVAIVVAVLAEAGNQIAAGEPSGARWNLLFFAGLLLAWRGWSLAEGWIDRELVEAELQVGTLIVLGTLLVLTWLSPGAGLLPAVGFLAAGLVGLGLARRAERRAPRAGPETDWLALVGALVGLVIVVGVGVVLLITPDLLAVMVEQAQVAASVALGSLGALMAWLGSLFPSVTPPPDETGQGAAPGPLPSVVPRVPAEVPVPPFWLFELLFLFSAVLILVVGGRLLYRVLKSRLGTFDLTLPRQREPGPAISEAPPFSWGSWWRSVLAWLRGWLASGAGRSGTAAGGAARAAAQAAEERSIRALYREFLTVVQRAGFQRSPATTPAELARTVGRARPAASGAVGALTELYVRARYGQETVNREQIARMRSAVQAARRELTAHPNEPPEPAPPPPIVARLRPGGASNDRVNARPWAGDDT